MSAHVLRVVSLVGVPALVVAMASCATNEDASNSAPASDASIPSTPVVDEASTSDVIDAGCDASSIDCVVETTVACDDFEWCPEKTGHPQGLGLSSVWGSSANDVWVVGAFGSVLHWDGKAWASVPAPTHVSLRAIWGTGPGDVWAVSSPDAIFRSTGFSNGTTQWTVATPVKDMTGETPAVVNTVWSSAPGDVWVGGEATGVIRDDNYWWESGWRTVVKDGAPAWAHGVDANTYSIVRGIWGTGADDVWIVGTKGQNGPPFGAHINGTDPWSGGPAFQEIDTQCLASLYGVWGTKSGGVWAVGDYGTIRHYTEETGQWMPISSPTQENLRAIWGANENDIWAVGEHATLVHWDGTTWRTSSAAFAPGIEPALYGVWGSSSNDVWAVGSGFVIHFTGPKATAQGATP